MRTWLLNFLPCSILWWLNVALHAFSLFPDGQVMCCTVSLLPPGSTVAFENESNESKEAFHQTELWIRPHNRSIY